MPGIWQRCREEARRGGHRTRKGGRGLATGPPARTRLTTGHYFPLFRLSSFFLSKTCHAGEAFPSAGFQVEMAVGRGRFRWRGCGIGFEQARRRFREEPAGGSWSGRLSGLGGQVVIAGGLATLPLSWGRTLAPKNSKHWITPFFVVNTCWYFLCC